LTKRRQKPARKTEDVILPDEGTNRGNIFRLMKLIPLTGRGNKHLAEHLVVSTNCPVEALLLVEDTFLQDDDRMHLAPIRDILIQAGFYVEMVELVKPCPLVFDYKGKVYYYPHKISSFEWLDRKCH